MTATIRSNALTVTVAARGAELVSVRDHQGHQWIWPAGPLWRQSAPLLFPVIGASAGGALRWGGKAYPVPIHGFAAQAEFEGLATGEAECAFRLTASAATRAVFPFDFVLSVAFAVAGRRLTQTVSVSNPSADALPVQIGLHPGFVLPAGDALPVAVLETDEAPEVDRLRAGYRCERVPNPAVGGAIDVSPAVFADGGILFRDVTSRSVWYGRRGAPGVAVSFGGFPDLALWTKPPCPYLCIEPWQGLPDREDFTGALTDKGHIAIIASGETLARRCTMDFGVPQPS